MPWKEVSIMSQRLEFVTLASAEKANIRHLCRCYGLSSATAYKWLHRFQSTGVNGLADRSRRPHQSPSRSAVEMEAAIINLRLKHPAWGGRKLRERLLTLNHTAVPSSSTILGWSARTVFNGQSSTSLNSFRKKPISEANTTKATADFTSVCRSSSR